jgi:hypothetical protein
MIDTGQRNRNLEPSDPNTSLFCQLKFSDNQNYRIDKALEEFSTIEELTVKTKCTIKRVKSHIRYIEKNCPHAKREWQQVDTERFRFVL